jgi:uncharacterized protein DUF2637
MAYETGHDSDGDGARLARLAQVARGRKAVAYCLLAVVMGSVAAMSWAGIYGFAHQTMHWSPGHAALVPVALDVAAITCAFLALDSLSRNDPAVAFRVLTAALVALSAFVNWRHALTTGNVAEQVFFPAMSILSYALIDAVLRKYRRDLRRDRAGMPAREAHDPLPRLGPAVWVRYPRQAGRAVSAALAKRLPASIETDDTQRRADYAAGVLDGLTQADAIRRAIEAVGDQPRQVVAWLADRGLPDVPTQRVYDVLRRDRGKHTRADRPMISVAPEPDEGAERAS